MSVGPGSRVGSYEIVALLGSGGMGEVYRARDTNLGRDVAIKVLPDVFASDPDRLARFEREARVLAQLNHPNIATIHGLERAPSSACLVMELVPGETLAARIGRGRVPVAEAMPIALQLVSALEAAHEKGIIHRDLKPANIIVAPDGKVKVLDFGLAKAAGGDGPATDPSLSPTMPHAGTMAGIVLGTAAYMSPEQARGKAVDKRTDIWSFGCVLFEMLAGKPAFAGETLTDIIAAVVTNEPAWAELPPDVPRALRSAVRRCLRKDPAERVRDIADAFLEVRDAPDSPEAQAPANWKPFIAAAAAAAAGIAATLLTVGGARTADARPELPVTRLELTLPNGVDLYGGAAPGVALSPDGTQIAFIGVLDGERRIYLRKLDSFDATLLRGTDQAQTLFFSADGSAVVFITPDRMVKKLTLSDGLIVTIARDADQYSGGSWGADGNITINRNGPLLQMPASGGTPTQLTTLDTAKGEMFHVWPTSVGDGQTLLFTTLGGEDARTSHVEALSTRTGERRVLAVGAFPIYSPTGHIIFLRDRDLLAAPFDATRLELTGPAARVLANVGVDFSGAPLASLSASGTLAFASGGTGNSRLAWVTRDGLEQPFTESTARYQSPRLAPDGKLIALHMGGRLWIYDTVRATFSRLPVESVGSGFMTWTPDGKRVAYRTRTGMRWFEVDGGGRSQVVADSVGVADIPTSIAPDGDTLVFIRQDGETSGDVYAASLTGKFKARSIVRTPAYEGGGQISPDGRWLAYVSNESGQFEVYLRPLSGIDRRWSVSTRGGSFPLWRRDGKELFYRSGNRMIAVEVSSRGGDLQLSSPRTLFEQRYAFETSTVANYDISIDGSRFLMVKDEFGSGHVNLVLNWFDELKRLAPVP